MKRKPLFLFFIEEESTPYLYGIASDKKRLKKMVEYAIHKGHAMYLNEEEKGTPRKTNQIKEFRKDLRENYPIEKRLKGCHITESYDGEPIGERFKLVFTI